MGDQSSGEDFAALLESHGGFERLQLGQTIKGTVVQIGAEHVFVDVAGKGEALVAKAELLDDEGKLEVSVGDSIEATVVELSPEIRLSRKLARGAQAREQLAASAANGIPVQGKVAAVVKGGFEVTVAGLRAFCPVSQIDSRRVEDPESYVGQVYDFRVLEFADGGRKFVVSRRRLLDEQAQKAAEATRERLVVGAVLAGTVTSVMDFGAFVDVGGIQGLVHLSELSHRRADHPSELVQPGQAVTVKVLKVEGGAKGKLSLSMKALEDDPWLSAVSQLRPRQVVDGRYARATDFGVFIELLPGVDGLLHQSELPRGMAAKLRDAVKARERVSVLILEVDPEKRRVSLALAPDGASVGGRLEGPDLAVGSVVTGTVEEIKPFGVMLRLGPGCVGLIPNMELGTPRGADHGKLFPQGMELKVEILAVEDRGKRIRLSKVAAERREEREEVERHGKPELTGGLSSFGDLLRKAQEKTRR